jgi:dTDP-D-glucose 4,6-dehydratase
LDYARWLLDTYKAEHVLKVFFQVSTDEVYGPSGEHDCHPEWSPILPSNPYAASKAAQEACCISYWRCNATHTWLAG